MSLEDRLSELSDYPAAEDVPYTPKTEFDGGTGFIQTGPLKQAPKSHTEIGRASCRERVLR